MLLTVMVSSYSLGSSMGLAHYRSMGSSMFFVNRDADRGSIAMLNNLVVGLSLGGVGMGVGSMGVGMWSQVSRCCSDKGKAEERLKSKVN